MTFLYTSSFRAATQPDQSMINHWKHITEKSNWRIVQLPNGFYQTEYKHPEEDDWVDVTRRETMDGAEAASDPQWLLESKWREGPLLVCSENDFRQLNELDILFIQESNFELSFNWPTNVIRIGCQHGIDVKLSKTLVEYGGCLEFDYILTSQLDDCPNIDEYSGYFPKALRQASSASVTTIPFGSIRARSYFC